jgi:ParB family chromosome partitioning protein
MRKGIPMNQLTTPALEPRLIFVPISRLNPIAHGVRKTNGISIDALAASIAAEGLLQNLTVVPDPDAPLAGAEELQSYQVIAGSRRLRALRKLVGDEVLPPDYEVPCRVIEESQALTASLAENAIREPMHPADEFVAFQSMIDAGKSIEHIAARFGVTPLVVQRRLKLANVSLKLFELFRTDQMDMDQMMALAIIDDHAAQEAVWFKAEQPWQRSADRLRKALTATEIDASEDPLAKFVGVQAYERAGGVVHRDLFSDNNAGYIVDGRLLQSLAAAKLEEIAERVRKEAWSWVEVRPTFPYDERSQFSTAQPTGKRKPTDVERKRIKELTTERNALEKQLNEMHDDEDFDKFEDLENRIADTGSELRSIEVDLATYSPAVLSTAGAIITLENGELEILRGLVKGKLKVDKETKAAKAKEKAKDIKSGAWHSEALTRELSANVTFAIAAEMIANPGMAIIALTHKLALAQFYSASSTWLDDPVQLGAPSEYRSNGSQKARAEALGIDVTGNPDIAKLCAEREALKALLPKKTAELLGWLKTQDSPVSRVLAFCIAESIDGVVADEKNRRAAALASSLNLDMSTRWSAGDGYLSRISADFIRAAMADAGATKVDLAATDKMKKAELAAHAKPLLTRWLPKFMRFTPATKE